jgi:small subunit ribosomal protein S20
LEAALANTRSAIKRIRSNERKRVRNRTVRSHARTAVTTARSEVEGGGKQSEAKVLEAVRQLDRAAEKGILHKNNAARRKSRLMKRLHKAGSAKPA